MIKPAVVRLVEKYGRETEYEALRWAITADAYIGKLGNDPNHGLVPEDNFEVIDDNLFYNGLLIPYSDFEEYQEIIIAKYHSDIFNLLMAKPDTKRVVYYNMVSIVVAYDTRDETIFGFIHHPNDPDVPFPETADISVSGLSKLLEEIYIMDFITEDILDQGSIVDNFICELSNQLELDTEYTLNDVTYKFMRHYGVLLITHSGVTHVAPMTDVDASYYLEFPGTPIYEIFKTKINIKSQFDIWYDLVIQGYIKEEYKNN